MHYQTDISETHYRFTLLCCMHVYCIKVILYTSNKSRSKALLQLIAAKACKEVYWVSSFEPKHGRIKGPSSLPRADAGTLVGNPQRTSSKCLINSTCSWHPQKHSELEGKKKLLAVARSTTRDVPRRKTGLQHTAKMAAQGTILTKQKFLTRPVRARRDAAK